MTLVIIKMPPLWADMSYSQCCGFQDGRRIFQGAQCGLIKEYGVKKDP